MGHLRRLTFDLSGPPQAGPLEGRVRPHSALPVALPATWKFVLDCLQGLRQGRTFHLGSRETSARDGSETRDLRRSPQTSSTGDLFEAVDQLLEPSQDARLGLQRQKLSTSCIPGAPRFVSLLFDAQLTRHFVHRRRGSLPRRRRARAQGGQSTRSCGLTFDLSGGP